MKQELQNIQVEFEEDFSIDAFSESEQKIFFNALLDSLKTLYTKTIKNDSENIPKDD